MAISGTSGRLTWRLLSVALVLGLSTTGLVARLAYLQIVRHQDYTLEAQGEHLDRKIVPAHRGNILDRNLNPLATSVDTFDILVDRHVWQDARIAQRGADALAPLLHLTAGEIEAFTGTGDGSAVIAQAVDYDTGRSIEALGLPGVLTSPTSRRIYPEGDLASPLLGFTGRDQSGLTGIERDFNDRLSGTTGQIDFERDSLGNPIAFGRSRVVPAQPGADVVLTIDRTLQTMAERELDSAVQSLHATGGDILIMDPQTGAVLAMASRPAFQVSKLDLSQVSDQRLFKLRSVTDQYEPGSVFKLITMAAALNEGRVTPSTTYVDSGQVVVGGRTFHNWDFSVNGRISMTDVLVKSLNTGSIFVSKVLGRDLFYQYVKAFGFGTSTHSGLSGEASGSYRTPDLDPNWSPADLAANSFGQGLSATVLQMLTAACVIANGGKLMQPYVVQSIRDAGGDHPTQPVVVREPISPQTAATLTGMMKAVLAANSLAKVRGYSAAGKSGTAYVSATTVSSGTGDAYASEVTIPSYLGFAPLDHPRLAILVKLNNLSSGDLGGQIIAPIFSRLMHAALVYLRVPEDQPAAAGGQ
ncbi:MAG: peptidoglycan D,D-transpeptidase FtsI family protein [Dehalococcoidia bacterium]